MRAGADTSGREMVTVDGLTTAHLLTPRHDPSAAPCRPLRRSRVRQPGRIGFLRVPRRERVFCPRSNWKKSSTENTSFRSKTPLSFYYILPFGFHMTEPSWSKVNFVRLFLLISTMKSRVCFIHNFILQHSSQYCNLPEPRTKESFRVW